MMINVSSTCSMSADDHAGEDVETSHVGLSGAVKDAMYRWGEEVIGRR